MKKLYSRIIILAAASLFCASASAKLRVVVSTSQIADIVRNIGGEEVDLTVLMGPGVDPHMYKATARDVVSFRRADLILYNGHLLEGRLADTFSKVDERGGVVVAVAESLPVERLIPSSDYEDAYDPHVWFDPGLWVLVVAKVEEALSSADPERSAIFAERSSRYQEKVRSLSDWATERIARVPEERRVLVTSHDAYNYFGRSFGFQVVGVQGVSTATEAGIADIASTSDFIKERGIPAIFIESSVAPGTIERISRDSGAKVGGELFSDALGALGEMHMGPDGESYDVGTYVGMFKYNVQTIVDALK